MARTTEEIMADLIEVRSWNKAIYEEMENIEPVKWSEDRTMEIVRRAYLKNPDRASQLHLRILANDVKNLEFTRELIVRYRGDRCE